MSQSSKSTQDLQTQDAVQRLVEAADAVSLAQLVLRLAAHRPDVRRECIEFLHFHVVQTDADRGDTQAAAVWAMWDELQPLLAQVDDSGDYEAEEKAVERIHHWVERLRDKKVRLPESQRVELIESVLSNLDAGSASLDDALFEAAFACCNTDQDWRLLAERLEFSKNEHARSHARRIYRRLGDTEKYLALRLKRLDSGSDYHDLATFYWDQNDRQQALNVAYEGLQKVKGRMDELRAFLAERAKEFGDREGFLELQFVQRTRALTLDAYKAFVAVCSPEEWALFEPRMLKAVEHAKPLSRMRILAHRGDHAQAADLLSATPYPADLDEADDLVELASRLEVHEPERMLAFYRTGVEKRHTPGIREEYAHQASLALRMRRLYLDVLRRPDDWSAFGRNLKQLNRRRFAFQEEFAKVVPEWASW